MGCWRWLEENNFTDLTFGEKENSEQGPTVRTKQASYASSSVQVLFSNPTAQSVQNGTPAAVQL